MEKKRIIEMQAMQDEFYEYYLDEDTFDNSETCIEFGCGKALSLIEKLYGNRCADHQERRNRTYFISKRKLQDIILKKLTH